MDILEILFWICEALETKNIPYMLSSSLAMNAYTMPRMTRDVDIVIALQEDNSEHIFTIFGDAFYWNEQSIREEICRQGMFNVIHHQSGVKIDFMVLKDMEFRQWEFSRRKKIPIGKKEVYLVNLEDLIISKLIWIQELQSEKQMEDIRNLLENPDVDMPYICYWIERLSLKTFNLL